MTSELGQPETIGLHSDADPETASPEFTEIAGYRISHLVGSGAMGNVFRAHDPVLDRPIAIKLPRVDVLGNPRLQESFLREAKVTAALRHPGLVEIYQFGVSGGTCFLASRWCDGGDLTTWMRNYPGPRRPEVVARFVRSLCEAVAHCHQSGILHLDIKPGNILLDRSRSDDTPAQPLLADFGLARLVEQGFVETQSSMLLGTPYYMAPEQAEGRRDDFGPSTDIFAIGVVLYQMLYDIRPFDGTTTMEVLDKIRRAKTIKHGRESKTHKDLRAICQVCLQARIEDRYASAQDLADDLTQFIEHRPITARPPSIGRRLLLWSSRPERIRQVSVVSLAVHFLPAILIINLLLLLAFDVPLPIQADPSNFAWEFGSILLISHLPPIVISWFGLRGRWWAVPLELLFALQFMMFTGLAAFDVLPRFAMYETYPGANFVGNFSLAVFAAGLSVTIATAIPAAIRQRKLASESKKKMVNDV